MSEEDLNIFQQALAESVHFSCKTINSNIEKGGIRLSQDQTLDLPYISARTLMANGLDIPTDYQANAGKTATIFKVVKAAQLNEDLTDADDEFKANVEAIKPFFKTAFQFPYIAGLSHLNVRLRQLLIPKNKRYISISPISAAGVNYHLNIAVDQLKEQKKADGKQSKLRNIQTAVFGIGGANPQNVGSLVRSMQRPIVMTYPELNVKQQQAFHYFYKGFDYSFSQACAPELYQQLHQYTVENLAKGLSTTEQLEQMKEKEIESPFSNMKNRAEELEAFEFVVNAVLQQGKNILSVLKPFEKQFPSLKVLPRDSFWSHSSVPLVIQGLINPELQKDLTWKKQFAEHLAQRIISHHFWHQHHKAYVKIPLDSDAHAFITKTILGILK